MLPVIVFLATQEVKFVTEARIALLAIHPSFDPKTWQLRVAGTELSAK